jgi:iron complex outermembrane receptor protein
MPATLLAAVIEVAAARVGWAAETAQGSAPAGAQPRVLEAVVVSGDRRDARAADTPAAIGAVGRAQIEAAGLGLHLGESLSRIPGVMALDRGNWAQDPQLSIRGFGARATFGIRGLRLLVDGIPASMPDGQGQASAIDLGAAERIEVLRGPLAQRYGNAAGGVIQVFSRRGRAPGEAGLTLGAGRFGTERVGLSASGAGPSASIAFDAAQLSTDGAREHAGAQRRLAGLVLETTGAAGTRTTLVAHAFEQPHALDPGGLTRAQLLADPRQASALSVAQNARKTVGQRQAGVIVEHPLGGGRTLGLRAHGGERTVFQALGLAPAAQLAPTASGGIVDLDRVYGGLGLELTQGLRLAAGRLDLAIGLEAEGMSERRLGFVNVGGQPGALKRDEDDRVSSTDAYAQFVWTTGSLSALAGLRASRIAFRIDDAFVVPGNPDDSGRVVYDAIRPVAGLTWHASEALDLYANFGRGLETPTLTELAYRADGGSGPNFALRAARSAHVEAGAKWRPAAHQRLDLALFAIGTDDEIVVASSSGGRTVFRNAARTQRRGIELAWAGRFGASWSLQTAATLLRAEFVDPFGEGADRVVAGNRVPGVPARRLWAGLAWEPDPVRGPFIGVELLHTGPIAVDDRNSDATDPTTTLGLRAGWRAASGPWRLTTWVRVDDATDARGVGSVIVNEAQRRFFEPLPGRSVFFGATVSRAFR